MESAAETTDVNSWINGSTPRDPERILPRNLRATISFQRKMGVMNALFAFCLFEYLIGFYVCIFTDLFSNVFYIIYRDRQMFWRTVSRRQTLHIREHFCHELDAAQL